MRVTLHTGVRTSTIGAEWSVWDTRCRLVVTDPWALHGACAVLEERLGAVDELVRPRGRHHDALPPVTARLDAALGRARPDGAADGPFPYGLTDAPHGAPVHLPAAGPAELVLDATRPGRAGRHVGPGGPVRAWAAQHCADALAEHTRCGVLVSIGGEVATAGLAPLGGWRIELGAEPGVAPGVVVVDGGAISRTTIATGPVWRGVAVAAATATSARAARDCALLRGAAAPAWLAGQGIPGRLVHADGGARTVGGWPAPGRHSSDDRIRGPLGR